MRIGFVYTSNGWGGLEMNILKLAKELSNIGYTISLISNTNSTVYIKGKHLFDSIIQIMPRKKYLDFSTAKALGRELKAVGIEKIIVFDNRDIDVVAWTKRLYHRNLKIIYQQQMHIGLKKKDFYHTFRYRAIDYWVAPLRSLKREVLECLNYPESRIKVIPLSVNTDKFTTPKYSKPEARKLLNISPQFPLVGIIGRIAPKKGQLFLAESLLKLKKQGIATELLIFGSPTINDAECVQYFDTIKKFVADNNLSSVVHFVDFNEDVMSFYNAVDVFVMASESETFGMVTIEAMLCELPVLGTNRGGTTEILGGGEYGTLFEYQDYDDYCKKLITVLSNPKITARTSRLGKHSAIVRFSLSNEVSQFDELLKSL